MEENLPQSHIWGQHHYQHVYHCTKLFCFHPSQQHWFVPLSWLSAEKLLAKRGVAVFSSRLCLASNCRNGFSLGGIVGKWMGRWSRRQLGLTHALRIPYAWLWSGHLSILCTMPVSIYLRKPWRDMWCQYQIIWIIWWTQNLILHSGALVLSQHKPGSPWENWWIPTTLQLHLFKSYTISFWDGSLTKLYATYSKQLSVKDAWNVPILGDLSGPWQNWKQRLRNKSPICSERYHKD